MLSLTSDLKDPICIHLLESEWFVLKIILGCVNMGDTWINFIFILLCAISEKGEEKKLAASIPKENFFYKRHLCLFINMNKFPEAAMPVGGWVFWNMRAPSLNPIKGAVSKLEVSSASTNTGFCSAERPGYSNATVQHEINKIKEQTLLRLKIKGDLGCQGRLQRSPGYCRLSSRTETGRQARAQGAEDAQGWGQRKTPSFVGLHPPTLRESQRQASRHWKEQNGGSGANGGGEVRASSTSWLWATQASNYV